MEHVNLIGSRAALKETGASFKKAAGGTALASKTSAGLRNNSDEEQKMIMTCSELPPTPRGGAAAPWSGDIHRGRTGFGTYRGAVGAAITHASFSLYKGDL